MTPDFPVVLVETTSRAAETGLEELRAALGRARVSTQMRPVGDMTAFAQQSNSVSAFVYAVAGGPADPPARDRDLAALTRFVASVRSKNPAVPIYLFGEQLSAVALPPLVLKEIHGFVNAFEDSADFVGRGIARAAQDYLDALAPPFFKALTDYAQRGAYSWHAPGHSGGTAFLKSPVGTMFHEFFGENMPPIPAMTAPAYASYAKAYTTSTGPTTWPGSPQTCTPLNSCPRCSPPTPGPS